jgi:hypothetical protein
VTKPKKPRTDAEIFDQLADEAELDRIKQQTPDEAAAELKGAGGDPGAVAARGAALAKILLAERKLDWKTRASARKDAMDKSIGEWPSFATMPRKELMARVDAARASARFSAPVVAMYRKRGDEEVTDDELRSLLEAIEVLRRLEPPKDE